MPEGPEVRTVARTIASEIVGKKLGCFWYSNQQLRREINSDALRLLENTEVDKVSCYGKVLFIHSKNEPIVMAQLGMTGQLVVTNTDQPLPLHTHIRWPLFGMRKEIRYIDPRRFGVFDVCDENKRQAILNKLGPDPFIMEKKDHLPLIKNMKRSTRVIKEVLLDQSVIAGVGNIYASEALFLSKIDPIKRACDVSDVEYKKLIAAVIDVLQRAYENCGTTFSNYVDGSGKKGDNLQFLHVFQREGEPCKVCSIKISRIKQGGRSTFYCENCQK